MNNEYIPFVIFLGFGLSVFVTAIIWRDAYPFVQRRRERKEKEKHRSDPPPSSSQEPVHEQYVIRGL